MPPPKMMELGAPRICPSTEATIKLSKTTIINFLGTLESNQKLITTKGMLNKEKACLFKAFKENSVRKSQLTAEAMERMLQ